MPRVAIRPGPQLTPSLLRQQTPNLFFPSCFLAPRPSPCLPNLLIPDVKYKRDRSRKHQKTQAHKHKHIYTCRGLGKEVAGYLVAGGWSLQGVAIRPTASAISPATRNPQPVLSFFPCLPYLRPFVIYRPPTKVVLSTITKFPIHYDEVAHTLAELASLGCLKN